MKVIFIRHGETEYNEQRKYCGSLNPPLSEKGRAALKQSELREKLKADPPDLVFYAPMKRVEETVEILFEGLPSNIQPPINELREIDFGDFEGKSYEELKDNPEYCAWLDTNCEGFIPGGDCPSSFREDCVAGFEEALDMARLEYAKYIAIVTHGGVIGAILEQYGEPRKPWYEWQVPPGGSIEINIEGVKAC